MSWEGETGLVKRTFDPTNLENVKKSSIWNKIFPKKKNDDVLHAAGLAAAMNDPSADTDTDVDFPDLDFF